MVRQVFKLKTHRYFVEPISDCPHAKVLIISRFVTFYRSLINCKKVNVRFLAKLNQNDHRTVLGRTLQKLSMLAKCSYESLTASAIKKNVKFKEVPDGETWRVPLLQELILTRDGELSIANLDLSETIQLIDDICTS